MSFIATRGYGPLAAALFACLSLPVWADIHADNPYATADELGLMQGFPPPPELRVDRSNGLFGVPYNRWSYQNMRALYPTAGIPHAVVPVDLPRRIDGGIDNLQAAREDGTLSDLPTWMKETYTDALVVIHDGHVVWERYLNGMNADQTHQMMSVTKSFAGLFGLMAVADGAVREDDLVTETIPELATGGAFDGATVGQVFDMTNSLDFSEDYADPNSGITQYSKVLGFLEAPADESPADSIYTYLPTLPQDDAHPHGEIFHYQTPKTDVVNWLTNRVTGESFQDNLYNLLWSKLGTDGETYVLLDRNGTLFAGGGLNATPNDLARFAAMMLADGMFNGQQVVDPAVIQQLSDGGDIDAFTNGTESGGVMGGGDWSYRAQWWVRHTPGHEAFTAIGVNGQWVYIDIDRDVAIVKQSSQPVASSNFFDEFNINVFDAIIAEASGS
ncbi:MAG: serine hydrolase [Rhodobacteraceae bacterium]|nr:serine hydrolase [Paracoccaceae bacterium]